MYSAKQHTTVYTDTPPTEWLARAQQLLAIPSQQDDVEARNAALNFIVDQLTACEDITVEHFERNGVKSILAYAGTTRPKRFNVILNGHVDVVPAKEEQFVPHIKDGRMYARGALDMKLAALVMTDLFCEFAAKIPQSLGLQIVTDEEPGGYDGAKYQYEQGVRTDFYITGEQSGNDIAVAAKGMCRIKIIMNGTSAHSAYLWRGDSALVKMMRLADKLLTAYPIPSEEAWVTTVNIARIETKSEGYFNRVPDAVEMHVDVRIPTGDPHFATEESARAFILALAPEAIITSLTLEQGHHVPSDDPHLKQLIAATTKARGQAPELLKRHGQSDIRHYNLDPHCQGVEFGLKGAHDHGDGEYAELSSVHIFKASLHTFLTDLG